MSEAVSSEQEEAGGRTDPNAETLAKQEVPILRPLGREQHAGDEEDRRGQHREPEVSPVEQSPDYQPGGVAHRTLGH